MSNSFRLYINGLLFECISPFGNLILFIACVAFGFLLTAGKKANVGGVRLEVHVMESEGRGVATAVVRVVGETNGGENGANAITLVFGGKMNKYASFIRDSKYGKSRIGWRKGVWHVGGISLFCFNVCVHVYTKCKISSRKVDKSGLIIIDVWCVGARLKCIAYTRWQARPSTLN